MFHSIVARMKDGSEKDAVLNIEHEKASVRAKVEHQFHIMENLFGFHKVWYRGISKNRSLLSMLFVSTKVVLYARQARAQRALC